MADAENSPFPSPNTQNVPTRAGLLPPLPEGWISGNISSMLAVVTVLLTFVMFVYFVQVSRWGVNSDDIRHLRLAQEQALTAQAKLDALPDEDKDNRTRLKKDLDTAQIQVSAAKYVLEATKDQGGVTKDFVLYILGVLSSILTSIFSYYFGSSRSSSKKDETLNAIAKSTMQ